MWKSLEDLVDRYAETGVFVLLPLISNFILGARSFFFHYDEFKSVPLCWAVAIASVLTSMTAPFAFAFLGMRPKKSLPVLLCQQFALILVFAGIYRGHGLMYGGPSPAVAPGAPPISGLGDPAADALYFSVVTWTTLGYGDFTVMPDIRLLPALEALLGYIFFGLIVGLATVLVSGTNEAPGSPSGRIS